MKTRKYLIVTWAMMASATLPIFGCASNPKSPADQTAVILFRGVPGERTETKYHNSARILTYKDTQLVRDRTETVDFTVATKVTETDGQTIHFSSTTTAKDGVVPLHDLAFPEMNETMDFVVKSTGQVLRAGRLPSNSIFYVPSVPIPTRPVEVGDTWTLEHVWNSSHDGLPLKLELVAILKDIVPCEKSARCADIEISGHVSLVLKPTSPGARFDSRLWGRMLFSLQRGDVIWSQTRSREDMSHSEGRLVVNSCMVSEMKLGKYRGTFECDVKPIPADNPPRL